MRFEQLLLVFLAKVVIDAGQARDSIDVARVTASYIFERLDLHVGVPLIIFTATAGNKLLCVSSAEVNLGCSEIGIEFNSLLEVLYGVFIVRIPESTDALVQVVASLQFGATGGRKSEGRQEGEHEFRASVHQMPPYLPA